MKAAAALPTTTNAEAATEKAATMTIIATSAVSTG